jgi:hypothetical protein
LELTLFEQNYHIQLPPPYNAIILGGARAVLVHKPDECFNRDNDDLQFEGVPEFMRSWPESDVAGWDESQPAELARDANDGGCWIGSEFSSGGKSTLRSSYHTDCCIVTASSVDMFPFVGPVPNREGNWMAAGFVGHGKLASFIYWHRRLTNATNPSFDSPHHSWCARFARLRIQAAGARCSIPSTTKTFPRYCRESGKTAEYRSGRQSSSI